MARIRDGQQICGKSVAESLLLVFIGYRLNLAPLQEIFQPQTHFLETVKQTQDIIPDFLGRFIIDEGFSMHKYRIEKED